MTDQYTGYGQPPAPGYPEQPPAPPQYGQAPYDQAAYGQSPYGQAPYAQTGYPPAAPPPPPGSPKSKKGLLIGLGGGLVGLCVAILGVVQIVHAFSGGSSSRDNGVAEGVSSASTPTTVTTPTTVSTPTTVKSTATTVKSTPTTVKSTSSSSSSSNSSTSPSNSNSNSNSTSQQAASFENQTASGHWVMSVADGWTDQPSSGVEPELTLIRKDGGDLIANLVIRDSTATGQVEASSLDDATTQVVALIKQTGDITSTKGPTAVTLGGEDAQLVQLEGTNSNGVDVRDDVVVTLHNDHVYVIEAVIADQTTAIERDVSQMLDSWVWKA